MQAKGRGKCSRNIEKSGNKKTVRRKIEVAELFLFAAAISLRMFGFAGNRAEFPGDALLFCQCQPLLFGKLGDGDVFLFIAHRSTSR